MNKLPEKLKLYKGQRVGNAVMVIIAVLILLFVPLFTFKNLRLEFSLEWIIAFVVLIVGIVRAIILNFKIQDLEIELGGDKADLKNSDLSLEYSPVTKNNWICEYCNKKFVSENLLKTHTLTCSSKKKYDEDEHILFIIYGSYAGLFILLFILVIIFLNRRMVSLFKIFIPISLIIIAGYILYMEFYLKEKVIKWLKS